MVHVHNGILLSHKRNAFELILMRWMNIEPIIQSKVSQKVENKYFFSGKIQKSDQTQGASSVGFTPDTLIITRVLGLSAASAVV